MRCFNGFGAKPCDGGGCSDQAGRGETARTDHCYASGCSDNFVYQSICAASHRTTICYAHNFGCQSIRNNHAIKHSNNCNINCSIKRRNKRAINCRNDSANKFIFSI